jgi:hypothetical protein
MRLFVYLPERKTSITLWLPEDSTVAFAKQCIIQSNRSTIAVSNDSFRLVCRGKEMKNEEKVGGKCQELAWVQNEFRDHMMCGYSQEMNASCISEHWNEGGSDGSVVDPTELSDLLG